MSWPSAYSHESTSRKIFASRRSPLRSIQRGSRGPTALFDQRHDQRSAQTQSDASAAEALQRGTKSWSALDAATPHSVQWTDFDKQYRTAFGKRPSPTAGVGREEPDCGLQTRHSPRLLANRLRGSVERSEPTPSGRTRQSASEQVN